MSFQTSNSGAFRSLHCLIYKVLAAASVAECFLFYHTFLSLSSTFSTFFEVFSVLCSLRFPLQKALLFYHISFLLSSAFFNFFKVFSALDSLPASSSRKLDYLTTSASVCQVLFSDSFEPFPSALQNPAPLSDSSLTIPNPPHFVNTFREKNWKFHEICRFLSVPAGLRAHFTWFFAGIGIYTANFSYILLL